LELPIYEYRCNSCEHELEKIQKMNDAMLVDCPECEQPALKRLISAAAFRLKGSGWYETDFKKDNKRNLAETPGKDTPDKKLPEKNSKKADPSPAANSAAKTDTKPAAKSVAKETKHA